MMKPAHASILAFIAAYIVRLGGAQKSTVSGLEGALQSGVPWDPALYPYVWQNESASTLYNSTAGTVNVPDPYRWLEDTTSNATQSFINAQQALYNDWSAASLYSNVALALAVQHTIVELNPIFLPCPENYSINREPESGWGAIGDIVYLEIAHESPIWFNATELGNTVNTLFKYGANVNLTWLYVRVSNGVSDWASIRILSIDTKTRQAKPTNETLDKVPVYHSSPTWTPDGQALLYSYYPHGSNDTFALRGTNTTGLSGLDPSLMLHVPGTPQSADLRLLSFPDEPTWHVADMYLSEDGSYLALTISEADPSGKKLWGLDMRQVLRNAKTGNLNFSAYDLNQNGSSLPWLKVVDDDFLNDYWVDAIDKEIWTVITNHGAPNYMVVLVNITQEPVQAHWRILVPEDPGLVLSKILTDLSNDTMLLSFRRGLEPLIQLRNVSNGHLIGQYGLPSTASAGGSITSICVRPDASDFYFTYSTLDSPSVLYRVPILNNTQTITVKESHLPEEYRSLGLRTELHHVPSKDGAVQIPLLILTQKNTSTARNTSYPTLLYGYGGQNFIEDNTFGAYYAAWVFGFNGVYAKCLPRGGGDLGWDWWALARGVNKSKTVDDFISCAQWLIDNNYTSRDKLVIEGASNGGLLMGMAVTRAPGLFTGVISAAGLYDMLRLEENGCDFAIGEIADAKDPAEFGAVFSSSPLHNIRQPNGTSRQYPAMLLSAGTADDRVKPSQTYKFVAQLQDTLTRGFNSPQRNPIVMNAQAGEGHTVISRVTALLFASKAVNASYVLPVQPMSSAPPPGHFSSCGRNHSVTFPALVATALGCLCGGALLAVSILLMAQKRRSKMNKLTGNTCPVRAHGTQPSFKD